MQDRELRHHLGIIRKLNGYLQDTEYSHYRTSFRRIEQLETIIQHLETKINLLLEYLDLTYVDKPDLKKLPRIEKKK